MPDWLTGKPFALTFGVLFLIVLARAQATYWIARGVTTGAMHTRLADRLSGPKISRAIREINRWGPPVVTVSFLTVGFQTVANAAAGLTRMPWVRYTVAMLIGCGAWALIYATVGIAALEAGMALAARSPWALVAVIAGVVAIGAIVINMISRRRKREVVGEPTSGR